MAAGDTTTRSLEYTPTWALATVCFIIIAVSIIIENIIHRISNWLKKRKKTALKDAVDKLKSELMLLGFISLLLAATQQSIAKICIPAKVAYTMLPCRRKSETQTAELQVSLHFVMGIIGNMSSSWRRLAGDEDTSPTNDETVVSAATDDCTSKGMYSLVTEEGIHQLHIFIFVLAVMQIVYTLATVGLGRAKMRRWKAWEEETQTTEYQVANDPNRFRFTRQTTFGRRHMTSCATTSFLLWIKCFFRQFFHSVAKVDYFTLRHGFISAHLSARNSNFNFQKYIEKSLEEDFKVVVSLSPLLWFIVVIFMLVDVRGWHVYLWLSYVPLLIVLFLGTKLEVVVANMAHQINEQNSVIKGTPLVQPNDNLFWFGRPKFVLNLIHFTLFTNAFELAFFIWVTVQFGFNSCYHEYTVIIITRLVLAVAAQVICSYITLPLYALVTQMGSEFKSKVLEDQVAKIIKQWHTEVRERRRIQEQTLQSPRTSLSTDWSSRSRTPEFSPRPPSVAAPSESIHFSNRGEITEEEEEVGRDGASSSRQPPFGRAAGMLELPTVRRV